MEIGTHIYGSSNNTPILYFNSGSVTGSDATKGDNAIFVRKGMRIKVPYNNSGSDGFVQFYPII